MNINTTCKTKCALRIALPIAKRSRSKKAFQGAVLWEGPSPYDGTPLVFIITGFNAKSQNDKTGPTLQTYVLNRDEPPHSLVKEGRDQGSCGGCPHSAAANVDEETGRASHLCYVRTSHGPLAVWKAYKRGSYIDATSPECLDLVCSRISNENRTTRLGSYGDSGMVPAALSLALAKASRSHTGYCHQWREEFYSPALDSVMMRSIESYDDVSQDPGSYRTFRVIAPGGDLHPNEIQCVNQVRPEINCEACGLCGGASPETKSIVAVVHGTGTKKLIAKMKARK